MLRAWLAVVAALSGACGSSAGGSGGAQALAIVALEPPCPLAGGTISLTIEGGDPTSCDRGQIFAAGRELLNLGVVTRSPLVLEARLPPGFFVPEGGEIKVVCGDRIASTRWYGVCSPGGGPPDAAADSEPGPDVSASCELPIEVVLEAVDRDGRAFARDGEGVFLVPINADDFAFDTSKSRNVSGRNTTYTFNCDCFTKVAVHAPVLGGFSAQGLWLDRRCPFSVEIFDLGCPEGRTARGQGTFKVVAAQ